MYLEREHLLSISAPKVDVEQLEAKIRQEIDDRNMQKQRSVNELASENIQLKQRLQRVEKEIVEGQKAIKELLKTA